MSASFIRQQQHSPPLRFATSSGTGGSPSVYPFSTAQTSATTGSYTTSLPPTSTSLGGQPLSYPYAASGQQGLVSSNVMGDYSRYGDSLAPHPGIRNSYFDQVAAASMGIANVLTEQLLSHPCIVLRRQCQVHADARSYHQTPFTLLPIAFSLRSNQGISSLWKGVGSSIVVKGMTSIVEILIGDTLGLPRYIVDYAGWDKILQHVALKMLSFCITTPFTVAAFIESVRSDTASDRTNPWDCVTNGLARLRYDLFGPKDNSKRFSIFYLAVPSVTYRFSHYVLAEIAYNL
uniref:Uncharacterized protein n=1 Tax=Plectus sambesii TaxID=2011161 RepID=A0A914X5X3_9BILA